MLDISAGFPFPAEDGGLDIRCAAAKEEAVFFGAADIDDDEGGGDFVLCVRRGDLDSRLLDTTNRGFSLSLLPEVGCLLPPTLLRILFIAVDPSPPLRFRLASPRMILSSFRMLS